MILVVGATGTVGSEVVRQLRAAGQDVRALARTAEKASAVEADGAMAVLGDVAQPDSLTAALEGVDRVFVVLPGVEDQVQLETNVIEAVKAAGSASIVKLSVIGADPDAPVRFGANHGKIERVLADSGVPHTLLRPTDFMQNSFGWAPMIQQDGRVYAPNADDQIASVDVRDIAAAAVPALTQDGHDGKVYELTGPEALTRHEQVATIAAATGREIELVPVTNEQARDSMLGSGYPEYVVGGLYELFEHVYDPGYAAGLKPGVREATGQEPRSWEAFARDHAQVFTG